jgi:hypothetical protein
MSELRLSSAERESAVAALGEHYAEGRLDKDEYDERSDAAWSAKTPSDLLPLFADLPGGSPLGPAVPAPAFARGIPVGPGVRQGSRSLWAGLPTGVQVLIVLLGVILALGNLPVVLVGLVVWFVLARHGVVGKPAWARGGHGGCGGRVRG